MSISEEELEKAREISEEELEKAMEISEEKKSNTPTNDVRNTNFNLEERNINEADKPIRHLG